MENNLPGDSSENHKKAVLVTVAAGIAVLAALVWWMKQAPSQQAQVSPTPLAGQVDSEAAAISQDVNNIDVGDLNAEFQAIDTDLQGL